MFLRKFLEGKINKNSLCTKPSMEGHQIKCACKTCLECPCQQSALAAVNSLELVVQTVNHCKPTLKSGSMCRFRARQMYPNRILLFSSLTLGKCLTIFSLTS